MAGMTLDGLGLGLLVWTTLALLVWWVLIQWAGHDDDD
jgi:hypothetical protein